ncbi:MULTISPECIES: DUF6236 family protein [unclassified Streptomyces]|uniref:DUF6236 family protein n=1 Tax=unclassified Streptomyces TaxID=2593676 RepID=UPI003244BE0C
MLLQQVKLPRTAMIPLAVPLCVGGGPPNPNEGRQAVSAVLSFGYGSATERYSAYAVCVRLGAAQGASMSDWFGLYYRHVHFEDERWLKLTALYWDRFYRFHVPQHTDTLPSISRTEIKLFEDKFLRDVVPQPWDVQQAAELLLQALDSIDLSRYSVLPTDAPGLSALRDDLAAWKAPDWLIERLTGLGLAAQSTESLGRIQMHSTLADAYMLLLGSQAAPGYGAVPLTEDVFDHAGTARAARRLVAGVLGQSAPELEVDERAALLVNLSVAAVLPRDLDAIAVDRIIQFKRRYAGERARFRDAVDVMVTEAAQLDRITEREVLLDHLQTRFDTRIRPALEDLQRAMRGQRMETAWGAINVQVAAPPVMTSALAVLATQPSIEQSAAIGLGGFAIGVSAAALQHRRRREQELGASPMAYLHQLQTGLAPLSLTERVHAAARRLAPPRLPT